MGASTNAPLILTIFAFYGFIGIMMGLIGGSYVASTTTTTPPNPDGITFLTQISYFFSGIAFSISNLGVFNLILFAPLGITLFYIVLSFLRGSS